MAIDRVPTDIVMGVLLIPARGCYKVWRTTTMVCRSSIGGSSKTTITAIRIQHNHYNIAEARSFDGSTVAVGYQ